MATTAKGVPYPVGGDPPDGPTQIHNLATWVDASPGIAPLTYAAINALSGAALWTGRRVYQTDTGTNRPFSGEYTYNGTSWRLPWNMPWGEVAQGVLASNAAENDNLEHVITGGWQPVLTAVANRLYRITLTAAWRFESADPNNITVRIKDGTTLIGAAVTFAGIGPSVDVPLCHRVRTTLTAGSHTIQITQQCSVNDGMIMAGANVPLTVTVDDIGPSGTPT